MPDHQLQLTPSYRQAGFSLLELTLVAVIMIIIAAIAIPDGSSGDAPRLESVARQFAEALRHARSESLRQGQPVAVLLLPAERRIEVRQVDSSMSPWSLAGNLLHPVSKTDYVIEADRTLPGIVVDTALTTEDGRGCDSEQAFWFDTRGSAWCKNPNDVAVREYRVTLTRGQHHRLIVLDGPSGRVQVE